MNGEKKNGGDLMIDNLIPKENRQRKKRSKETSSRVPLQSFKRGGE